MLNVILALLSLKMGHDLGPLRYLIGNVDRNSQQNWNHDDDSSSRQHLTAWASWIGEIPTAAELYGDASHEVPSGESFDDDDDDEELDASASNEYPENDENYEDAEDQQESATRHRWLRPPQPASSSFVTTTPPSSQVTPASLDDSELATSGTSSARDDGRALGRFKRDLDDISTAFSSWPDGLENRIPVNRRSDSADSSAAGEGSPSSDDIEGSFPVDDGNEDAWVHDGVDDIQIDPETKRAASELNSDQAPSSLDAEYEPVGGGGGGGPASSADGGDGQQAASSVGVPTDEDGNPIYNRTRVTTISEVIPTRVEGADSMMGEPDDEGVDNLESSLISTQYAQAPPTQGSFLPASHLSREQVQQLFNANENKNNKQ